MVSIVFGIPARLRTLGLARGEAMMRFLFLFVFALCTPVQAAFVVDADQSSAVANARYSSAVVEQAADPIIWPGAGTLAAQVDSPWPIPYASVSAAYSIGATLIRSELIELTRVPGSISGGTFSGSWMFSVDSPMLVRATGELKVDGYPTDNQLYVALHDFTDGELFDSRQWDFDFDSTYVLGGLDGNRVAISSGSLDNVLQPGRIYSLNYSLSSWGTSSTSGSSSATGFVQLQALPVSEPNTLWLATAALLMLAVVRRFASV